MNNPRKMESKSKCLWFKDMKKSKINGIRYVSGLIELQRIINTTVLQTL